jgi:hypothetical protein
VNDSFLVKVADDITDGDGPANNFILCKMAPVLLEGLA